MTHRPAVKNGMGFAKARLEFEAEGWLIKLDTLPNEEETRKQLDRLAGFMLTHVGRLQRTDGASFAPGEAEGILSAFYWFLTFITGRRTGPVFLSGHAPNGDVIWEEWSQSQLRDWSHVYPWTPRFAFDSLRPLFTAFARQLHEEHWKEHLTSAIHWYVAVLHQDGAVHGSMMMAQAALELLWWLTLVVDKTQRPPRGYAAGKLRDLLRHHSIPTAIPEPLTRLQQVAQERGWRDGPEAFVSARNSIVHPPSGRAPIHDMTMWEALQLGTWYIEMLILATLRYDDVYWPRFPEGGNVIDTKKVPWASP